MKLKNNFHIMRHGQTAYQTVKRNFSYPYKESVDVAGITKIGRDGVRRTISKVKKLSIDIIYASDFRRTRETAEMVARGIGLKKKPILTSKLRDVNIGKYHGGRKKDFYNDFPGDFHWIPKNGESLVMVRDRMISFIKEIDICYENKNILIVSHGDPLWLLEGAIRGSDMTDRKKNYIQPGELRKLN